MVCCPGVLWLASTKAARQQQDEEQKAKTNIVFELRHVDLPCVPESANRVKPGCEPPSVNRGSSP